MADLDSDKNNGSRSDTASIGELVSAAVEQMSRLVRDELRLARAEVEQKGRKAGIGAGLFGGAGVLAFYGVGCLVAAVVLGLANAVAGWLAAVIVGVVLLLAAGAAALVGKKEVAEAVPPVPGEAIDGVRTDVRTVKEGIQR